MDSTAVRVLLVADTHLGFDLPFRPRIKRRRRGHDFFANFERALQPARQGTVDLVVHGGDLFFRSRVPPALVEMAMAPLVRVAEQGIPVYLVPGNHERSRIPGHLWTAHPNLHIFDRPRTFLCSVGGTSVALAGFPFQREIQHQFSDLVHQTGYMDVSANLCLLCMHQTVEGAQVGVNNFTFRPGPDVVRGADVPGGFGAILVGHIHRAQVLTHDLKRDPMAAPIIYPGSIERTSFAERDEAKGYQIVSFDVAGSRRGQLTDVTFEALPARPMVSLVVEPEKLQGNSLSVHVRGRLAALDPDSVVRIQLHGPGTQEARTILSAAHLRALAPPTMNITLAHERTGLVRGWGQKYASKGACPPDDERHPGPREKPVQTR